MNMGRGKSLKAYREEATKCVLVCANCHGEIEAGLIPSPPARARFGEHWDEDAVTPPKAGDPTQSDQLLKLSLRQPGA